MNNEDGSRFLKLEWEPFLYNTLPVFLPVFKRSTSHDFSEGFGEITSVENPQVSIMNNGDGS